MEPISYLESTALMTPCAKRVRYEILGQLGVGGMANVHLARVMDGSEKTVAIKRLHHFIAEDPTNVAILQDEAYLASCIRHPNVVRILDFLEGVDGTAPALVMECIDGVNLAALSDAAFKSGRKLRLDVIVAIVCDVLAGLHAAHEARTDDGMALEIVHRDVSPQNILIGFDGVTRLTDFGVAKGAWRRQVTELGAIKGKLGYMAPEQLEGKADRRADLYSAGVVLWELLTGRRLRTADGAGAQILVEIMHGMVEPPSVHASEANILDDIVMRALRCDPEQRFSTTHDMAVMLADRVTPASPKQVAQALAEAFGRADVIAIAQDADLDEARWIAAGSPSCASVERSEHLEPSRPGKRSVGHIPICSPPKRTRKRSPMSERIMECATVALE